MKCPNCDAKDTRVVDTRTHGSGFSIRRRRECTVCGKRFTTYEQIAETPVAVIKKDAARVPFDRSKIKLGIEKAVYKRPVSAEAIDDLVSKVVAKVIRLGEPEVSSQRIGELVMRELRKLDQVAYVRFASVYRNFQAVSDFEEEIRPMLSKDTE